MFGYLRAAMVVIACGGRPVAYKAILAGLSNNEATVRINELRGRESLSLTVG
jgi:hypothetical protein